MSTDPTSHSQLAPYFIMFNFTVCLVSFINDSNDINKSMQNTNFNDACEMGTQWENTISS